MTIPRSVSLLTGALLAAAAAISVVTVQLGGTAHLPQSASDWLALAGLGAALTAAGAFQVEFRRGEDVEAVDLFEAAVMPAVLMFTGPVAVVLAGTAKIASQRFLSVHPAKRRFNVAQWCLAVAVASLVFTLAGDGDRGVATAVPALLVAAVALMAVNHLAVMAVLRLIRLRSPGGVAGLGTVIIPTWLIGGAANLSLGVLFAAVAAWAPPLVGIALVPLALFDSAHRASTMARTDRARLASLHRATAALAKAVDPLDAVPDILREVTVCFGAEDAALVLLDDDRAPEPTDPELRDLAAQVAHRGASGRLAADDLAWRGLLEGVGAHDVLAAPVVDNGATIGVLLALSPSGTRGSAEGESAVLAAIASELTTALAKARAIADALAERRLLAKVFDTTSDGVCAIRHDDDAVVTWNRAMEELTGYGAGELPTGASLAVLEPIDSAGHPVTFTAEQSHLDALPSEVQVRNRLGERIWLACTYAMAPGRAGQAPMLVLTARDVTEARERARLKDEFVSIASHELRTPATVVRGMAQSLMDEREHMSEEEQQFAVQAIFRGAMRLNRVVTNVLAVSRIERDQRPMHTTFDLGQVCREAVQEVRQEGSLAAVDLDLREDGAAPTALLAEGSASATAQILVNLLTNAAKYGGGGPVSVTADVSGRTVAISVADRGPGIPLHEQERIFRRFERLHQHNTQAGTGLGLYIARQLAESMGGGLVLQSRPGEGATFTLWLPRATVEHESLDADLTDDAVVLG